MAKCAKHMPGNTQCPNAAIYEIEWTPHRIGGTKPLKRLVCISHLAPAIDEALDDGARGADVKVRVPNQ